ADTTNLASQLGSDSDSAAKTASDSLNTKQSSLLAEIFKFTYYGPAATLRDTARVNRLMASPEVKSIFPSNMRFLWAAKPSSLTGQAGGEEVLQLYAVKKGRDGKAPLTGEYITNARQEISQTGQPEVSMSMSSTGAKKWKKLTGEVASKGTPQNPYSIAIVLDDNVYSAPTVREEIPGGNSSISGNFTIEEAQDLAQVLKAGKLPAPTRIVEEAVVGPSLGQEAINQGLLSTIAGLVLVIIFMVMYYNRGGLIANFALLINIFFILGILSQFGAALTLPGIAGIVLTLGIAVDANVLIFERIKEELRQNPGMMMKDAIAKGYDRAFSSIFDSNVTSILVAFILYFFGTGPVKGFAITLIIGIICSFLTAVYITRLIIDKMAERGAADKLKLNTVFTKALNIRTNINFVGNRKKVYFFSVAVIALGIVAAVINGGFHMGVDFKGGRSYVVQFDKEMVASDVRSGISDDLKGEGIEVKTFGSPDRLKITTSYLADDESQEADKKVEAALMGGLKEYNTLNPHILSSAKVGATMAEDIQRTSQIAIVLSIVVIFLYILLRFRKWQYSLGAVLALAHDVIIVFAMIAIAGLFGINFEIDQIMIAAILTLVGYSINDTVVVFDRVREELELNSREPEETVINRAINITLSRTIVTSLTVFIVVVILFIFGGEVLRGFSYALLVGVVFGTYSSICIATPIVLDLQKKKESEKVAVTA
ncbi:MAG: protein translocase subunit SecD, partial [Sphingobacteriales bacterium]